MTKKSENRPFNVPIYGRILRSLVLKLAWKLLQTLKFSNSLTISLIFRSNIKFPDFNITKASARISEAKNLHLIQATQRTYSLRLLSQIKECICCLLSALFNIYGRLPPPHHHHYHPHTRKQRDEKQHSGKQETSSKVDKSLS